jgi:serine/threonine protein kinase
MKFFRQLLSAVGYCHSFNICHRDLKPENILLTKDLELKVADFGMAALHQTPEHRLQTPCGSPHYAAPEIIKATFYRGDKADIWSMGVILFASLAGYLPFDHKEYPGLLDVIKKGRFEMDPDFSLEAADLIHRMLQVNPRDRISVNQMWRHPLLRKYDYLDKYGGGLNPRSTDVWSCERPLLRRSDIDRELLRHLRSMWHTFEEEQIINLLLNEE